MTGRRGSSSLSLSVLGRGAGGGRAEAEAGEAFEMGGKKVDTREQLIEEGVGVGVAMARQGGYVDLLWDSPGPSHALASGSDAQGKRLPESWGVGKVKGCGKGVGVP